MKQDLSMVGTAMSFVPLDSTKVPKTPGLVLPKMGIAGLRDNFRTPTIEGGAAPAYMAMACFLSGSTDGEPLGKGTLSVTIGGPGRVPGDLSANRLVVEVVEIGSFDAGDIDTPGTVVGSTDSWPVGRAGSVVEIPVDFTDIEVPKMMVLRLRSDVPAPLGDGQSDWHTVIRGASLEVEAVEEVDEAGAIAEAFGLDRSVVLAIMALLGGSK